MRRTRTLTTVPAVSALWMRWFSAYAERYVRKHFHAVRVLRPPPPLSSAPLVVFLNHASWWDPMLCLVLRNRFFMQRESFAPIDADALAKYPFFRKLGFFPVEQHTARGAIEFLRGATDVLARPNAALWITPHGRFADVRERPVEFRSGLAHLAERVRTATFLPLAVEYPFWEERRPEICLSFGEPLLITESPAGEPRSSTPQHFFENRLRATQEELAAAVIQRDVARFRVIERSSGGVGGIYDLWRRTKAVCRGQSFQPEHGVK
jgi:1-acyl-sn-glycerol-3-phosphate acyltransferase